MRSSISIDPQASLAERYSHRCESEKIPCRSYWRKDLEQAHSAHEPLVGADRLTP